MNKELIIEGCFNEEDRPVYSSLHASGADLKASITEAWQLLPGDRKLVPTGVRLHIPEGYEGQVRPRSGLAHKSGITVLNTPGTIDSDYRGEIKVIMINLGQESFTIQPGDRIAQLVIAPVVQVHFSAVEELIDSHRGEGGFGSTGH